MGFSDMLWEYPWRNILATLANGTLTSSGVFPYFEDLIIDVHINAVSPPFREELKADTETVDLTFVALSERLPMLRGITFEVLPHRIPSTLAIPDLMASLFPRTSEKNLLRYRGYSYVWGESTVRYLSNIDALLLRKTFVEQYVGIVRRRPMVDWLEMR